MASTTAEINVSWTLGGSDAVRTKVSRTEDASTSIKDLAISAPVTDRSYTGVSIDVSEIKSIVVMCTKDATLETNSGSSPANTITLKANEPYIWWSNAPWVNKFTTDVTAMFLTVAGTGAFDFHCIVLQDPTP